MSDAGEITSCPNCKTSKGDVYDYMTKVASGESSAEEVLCDVHKKKMDKALKEYIEDKNE